MFTTAGLIALEHALATDAAAVTQGISTDPPPLQLALQEPVRAMCAVCYAATEGEPVTVGQAEEAFALACHLAGVRLGDPVACRWLLNWIDDTPRAEMRVALLAEVRRELAQRASAAGVFFHATPRTDTVA